MPTLLIDFYTFYDFFFKTFDSIGLGKSAAWMSYLTAGILISFTVINVMILSTALYTWFERRVLGRFHVRRGPNRHGPFGLLQPIADVLKLIMKEDTLPDKADKPVMTLAPICLLYTSPSPRD